MSTIHMADGIASKRQDLPAGRFSTWLVEFRQAQQTSGDVSVPCGECTACCTSSQFIHIGSDETETLARIPGELLFPTPGMPKGNVLMGYDDNGHCPMFVDGQCSIYEDRPRTCRTYDCRVLAATRLQLDDDDKAQINERAQRWKFEHRTHLDRSLHDAVLAAAAYLQDNAHRLPAGLVPRNHTQLGFVATEIHDVFVASSTPPLDVVEAAILRLSAP